MQCLPELQNAAEIIAVHNFIITITIIVIITIVSKRAEKVALHACA